MKTILRALGFGITMAGLLAGCKGSDAMLEPAILLSPSPSPSASANPVADATPTAGAPAPAAGESSNAGTSSAAVSGSAPVNVAETPAASPVSAAAPAPVEAPIVASVVAPLAEASASPSPIAMASPVITQLVPQGGPTSGGYSLTIAGTGFRAGASVIVGSSECSSPAVATEGTSIACTVPMLMGGLHTVEVRNQDGARHRSGRPFVAITRRIQYSVVMPTIASTEVGSHEIAARQIKITHDADRLDCSRESYSSGFEPCGADGAFTFTVDDFNQGRSIYFRFRNSDGGTSFSVKTPLRDLPSIKFHACSRTLSGRVSKSELESALQEAPSGSEPYVLCLSGGAQVNLWGSQAITITKSNLNIVGTSVDLPTLAAVHLAAQDNQMTTLINVKLAQVGNEPALRVSGGGSKRVLYSQIVSGSQHAIRVDQGTNLRLRLENTTVNGSGNGVSALFVDSQGASVTLKKSELSQDGIGGPVIVTRGSKNFLSIEESRIHANQGGKDAIQIDLDQIVQLHRTRVRGCASGIKMIARSVLRLQDVEIQKASDPSCTQGEAAIEVAGPGNEISTMTGIQGNRACNLDGGIRFFSGFVFAPNGYVGNFGPGLSLNRGNSAADIGNCVQ